MNCFSEREPLKIAFYTFGCKVNLFETDQLKSTLHDVEIVSCDDDADIFIINGCTVTATAEAQVRNMIRRFEKRGRVIVTGCFVRKKGCEKIGNAEYIPTIADVARLLNAEELKYDAFFTRSRPFIKIQSGCDQFCSYCVIPYVRGPLNSVPLAEIEELLQKIADQGFHEVVLTGIHIGKYGRDLTDGTTLADVIEASHRIVGRVRLGSLESPEIDDRIFRQAADGMILPHWHIPLQSGSDAVLKAMNRPYKCADFARSIEKLVSIYKELPAFGTDIIAGFPTETEHDFAETLRFIDSLPFAYGHVFPFSPREGTPAAILEKKSGVPYAEKRERARLLRELFAQKEAQFKKSLDGRTDEAVIEERTADSICRATTSTYQDIEIRGEFEKRSLLRVKLSCKEGKLVGEPV
ncbi:MiaB/RimO family radical SAM methylthiotransferase [bacterium]|nr:MiaB/RimO family radical SAM methylthiotransferase [bacterium]